MPCIFIAIPNDEEDIQDQQEGGDETEHASELQRLDDPPAHTDSDDGPSTEVQTQESCPLCKFFFWYQFLGSSVHPLAIAFPNSVT